MAYKIEHDRNNCIGCSSCAAMDCASWRMSADGKADLLKTDSENDKGWGVKVFEEGFDLSLEVAQSCPVNVIHIVKDDKKVI